MHVVTITLSYITNRHFLYNFYTPFYSPPLEQPQPQPSYGVHPIYGNAHPAAWAAMHQSMYGNIGLGTMQPGMVTNPRPVAAAATPVCVSSCVCGRAFGACQ